MEAPKWQRPSVENHEETRPLINLRLVHVTVWRPENQMIFIIFTCRTGPWVTQFGEFFWTTVLSQRAKGFMALEPPMFGAMAIQRQWFLSPCVWINLDRIGQWSCFFYFHPFQLSFVCFRLVAQTPIPEVEGKPTGKPLKPIHWTNRSSESCGEPAGKLVRGEERDHDSKLSLVPYDPRVESQFRASLIWRYFSYRMNWYL